MNVHDGHRQKLKERFQNSGLENFADHEALELLLFFAIPRKDTNVTAHLLLERYGSLEAVLSAPMEDLKRVDGVGECAATLIRLVPQICHKARLSAVHEIVLNSTQKAGAYLLEQFVGKKNEVIYELCLDRKGKLISCKRLTEGNVSNAELDIRRLVENAILTSASVVILAHNHPSGIALPSQEDYATTERARCALETIGVTLADHIIVADNDYVSLADSGLLTRRSR